MRRTYKSKKDTGGVLDRRDLLQNLDEKSSAYDAFFIQNIKQTKRELSCVGSSNAHGVAYNRVRKRKYVKRVVKEVETPCRESLSRSAYLTPDKSIRVNKPLDPFDMLLNTSNACTVQVQPRTESVTRKVDVFDKLLQKKEGKTYTRRKPAKLKKVNYSDSDSSDSDKENSDEKANITRNTSDIKAYQLHIENEVNTTPKRFNDSINKIVNNLSLLHKLKHQNSFNDSTKKPLNYYKHRLTRNIQSPILQKSPLCSTPFKVKYRGESIFKFSPITVTNDDDDSPKYTTTTQDNDDSNNSIVFLGNNQTRGSKDSKRNTPTSTVEPAQTSVDLIPNNSINCDKEELMPEIETNAEEVFHRNNTKEEKESTEIVEKSNATSSVEISSLQITEFEPFLGFSNDASKEIATEDVSLHRISDLDDTEPRNDVTKIELDEKSGNIAEDCQSNLSTETNNMKKDNNTSIESENDDRDSLYDTCNSDQSSIEEKEVIKIPIVKIRRMNDSSFMRYYEKINDFDSEGDQTRESLKDEDTDDCNDSLKGEKNCKNDMSIDDKIDKNNLSGDKEQIPKNNVSQEDEVLSQGEEYASFEDSNASNEQTSENDNSTDVNADHYLFENEASEYIDIVSSNDDDGEFYEEEKCVSFVTTRRRNEVTNNSMMSFFNDSYASSSTDCDKTVVSNKKDPDYEISKENIDENETLMNLNEHKQVSSDEEVLELRKDVDYPEKLPPILPNCKEKEDTRISFVTNRNSNITDRKSSIRNRKSSIKPRRTKISDRKSCSLPIESMPHSPEPSRKTCFEKPDMVLQPGKKWERSLSISSTDCDKTVVSIEKDLDYEISKENIDGNETLMNLNEHKQVSSDEEVLELRKDVDHPEKLPPTLPNCKEKEDTRISFVTNRNSNITDRKSSIRNRKSSIKPRRTKISDRKSCSLLKESMPHSPEPSRKTCFEKPGIVLQPGKKWERSLSIFRRMTMITDHFDQSILEDEPTEQKGRKYRQSVIETMERQELNGSLHNESINSRRSTFVSKPCRSTIRIVKDPDISRLSLCNTSIFDDLKGFLNEECDDTIIELSKLSIADQTHEVTVLDTFHDTSSRIATARDYVLRRCNQPDAILFDECYPDTLLKNCHKIGEGVYGEVFLWRARDGRARVLKIVPIAGTLKVNGESQKDFHEIISEIVIAMELSALRAPIAEINLHFDEGKDVEALDLHAVENATDIFNEVLAVRCVYGSYPARLLDLWDLYDECKGSENDNPAILPADQQFIVLELANAGQDLESYQFNNAEQAYALFMQVAYGLAVAEEAFQFEHRDLHWGNVLIAPTEQKYSTFVLRGRSHRVPRCGVAATIIDYSLSRVSLPLAGGECAALYNDLGTDESLFEAVGDYQFEVYRLMRDKLGNDWKNFAPYTNILWLHYTVDKMITALRYKRTNTKIHKHYIDKLKGIKSRILDYGSAALFVLTDNEI